jgi:hypothetical protein
MVFRKMFLVCLLVNTYASFAVADDACTIIAKQGLYDTHVTKSSTQTFSQFKSTFCSWYGSYRESHSGGSAGVTIPIVDIPIGFSGSMTFGEADSMYGGLCSSTASSNSDQTVWSDVTHYIDPTAATAFSDCVKATRGGLAVDPNVNDDETLYTISVVYHPPDGANPTTITNVATVGWICSKPENNGIDLRDFVNKSGEFSNRQVGMVCKRDIKAAPYNYAGIQVVADPAMIAVQTYAGNYTQFFRPKVYQDPMADTAKVLASYPKGTILPYAGHIVDIPAGWHMCDGHDGTVNLVDYIPYGASTDAQVDAAAQDKHEGNRQHVHTVPDTAPPYRGFNSNVLQGNRGFTAMGNDTQHHIGNTGAADNLPAVTRVFFIEKIN